METNRQTAFPFKTADVSEGPLCRLESDIYDGKKEAAAAAQEKTKVHGETLLLWLKDYVTNDYRFSESKTGKKLRRSLWDQYPLAKDKAKTWLEEMIEESNSKKAGARRFTIKDFTTWLNDYLFVSFNIKPTFFFTMEVLKAKGGEIRDTLTVEDKLAGLWAVDVFTMLYVSRTKSYHTQYHDREDVVHDRQSKYIPLMKKLEYRQWLWYRCSLERARTLGIEMLDGVADMIKRGASKKVVRSDAIPEEIVVKAAQRRRETYLTQDAITNDLKKEHPNHQFERQGLFKAVERLEQNGSSYVNDDDLTGQHQRDKDAQVGSGRILHNNKMK